MKLLMVDDDPLYRELLGSWLDRLAIPHDIVGSALEAMAKLRKDDYDGVFTDLFMPNISGIMLIEYVKNHYKMPIAVLTNFDQYELPFYHITHKYLKPNEFPDFIKVLKKSLPQWDYPEPNLTSYD